MTEVHSHIVWSDEVARQTGEHLAQAEGTRLARPFWKRAARKILGKSRRDRNQFESSVLAVLLGINHNSVSLRSSIDDFEAQLKDVNTLLNAAMVEQVGLRSSHARVVKEVDKTRAETVRSVLDLAEQMNRISFDFEAANRYGTAIEFLRGELAEMKKSGSVSRPAADAAPEILVHNGEPISEELYSRFEDLLRGGRSEIKARLSEYVPAIVALPHPSLPVVDLGCGRGEWLELMAESQTRAYGLELNKKFVDENCARGLDVRYGDAIKCLLEADAGSIRAVTAFHLIEHVPTSVLLELLTAAQHALAPGGKIIFETPNPTNVMVGAANFYIDPTHIRPVHPALVSFLADAAGFRETEILYLHPAINWPESLDSQISADEAATLRQMWTVINGPQDFSLIATK